MRDLGDVLLELFEAYQSRDLAALQRGHAQDASAELIGTEFDDKFDGVGSVLAFYARFMGVMKEDSLLPISVAADDGTVDLEAEALVQLPDEPAVRTARFTATVTFNAQQLVQHVRIEILDPDVVNRALRRSWRP
jgi:hypothetical protein